MAAPSKNRNRTAAVRYAAAGIPVFQVWGCDEDGHCRCRSGAQCERSVGKHPHHSAPQGFKSATTDIEVVNQWYLDDPDAGIAMPTGALSGVDVLDLDTYNGASWAQLARAHEMRKSPVVVHTGRGGLQGYYANSGVKPSGSVLGKGVDTKGDGGYVVLPPTRGEKGRYTYHDRDLIACLDELPRLPASIVSAIAGGKRRQSERARSLQPGEKLGENDGRWDGLLSFLGTVRLVGPQSEKMMIAHARAWSLANCDPQYPEKELIRAAKDSFAYALGGSNNDGADVVATPGRFRLRRASEVTPVATRWLVKGKIPLGNLTILAGVGGLGKSTYALHVAAQVTHGAVPDGRRGDVVIVSSEDAMADTIRPRLEAAGADLAHVHELVASDDSYEQLSLPNGMDELAELVRSVGARMLIIDPIVASLALSHDAHKDQHVRNVTGPLRRLADETEMAAVLIMHLNKTPSSDAFMRLSSSGGFWNAARSVVFVAKDPEDDDGDARIIFQQKSNYAAMNFPERWRLELVEIPHRDPETGAAIEAPKMVYVEDALDVEVDDLLSTRRSGKSTAGAIAAEWLAGQLADGEEHKSDGLKTLAATQEIKERTLKRAAVELGVEQDRRGFPAVTYWRLPS